ncbi:MAG: hypothetical protein H7Y17_04965 [Chlorobia bacterium]|nr:hypothetical protein [Fimbriimonadaceae bacterium]
MLHVVRTKQVCLLLALFACSTPQAIVTKAQFSENLRKGTYSYQIQEFTKSEWLAVGAWNGSRHPVLRWAKTGGDDQRFVFVPIPGTNKFRIETMRGDVHDRVCLGIEDGGGLIAWPRKNDKSQQFELNWQIDTIFLALKEGTKGEFLDVAGNGNIVRWTGVDGKNDKPKSNQRFMLWNPRLESKPAGSLFDQIKSSATPFAEFIQNPYMPYQPGGGAANLHINGMAMTGGGKVVLNYPHSGGATGDLYHWLEGESNWKKHTFEMFDKGLTENRYPSGMQAVGDVVAVADNKYVNFFRVGATVTEMPEARFEIPSGNRENVAMAYHPTHQRVYLATMEGLYRSTTPDATGTNASPSANLFKFTRISGSGNMKFGEAGMALLYDRTTGHFLCLALGPDKAFDSVEAYKITLTNFGFFQGIESLGRITPARPTTQGGDDGVGSWASFRWGGTVSVSSDGNLEIYAAPKRLDNVVQNVSKVLKWRFGPRFVSNP